MMDFNLAEGINNCKCGKKHVSTVKNVIIGKSALQKLPEQINYFCAKKAFIVADVNTYAVAGEKVLNLLEKNGIFTSKYVFAQPRLEPDEHAVGSVILHYDKSCDIVVAIGSGVINDICKVLSCVANVPYIIVATAPSMDGYASASSSMARDGLKVTVNTKCPDVIIGDTDILKTAPDIMLKAGFGDMLAKYVSICEWRIAHELVGEYYCDFVAQLVRTALKKCVDNIKGLLKREDAAIEAVFEGLIIGGCAMSYAGLSRPASGIEHYFSHIWDMRGLEFGLYTELHGIQCAVGTLYALKLYECIKKYTPDKKKALDYVSGFDFADWSKQLTQFLGNGAAVMIQQESKELKYDKQKHSKRIDIIIEKWDVLQSIIREELPDAEFIRHMLADADMPVECESIGVKKELLPMTFKATKDIRDKYVLSRLAWDLGIIDELAEKLN